MDFEDPTKNIEQLVEEKVAPNYYDQKLTEENLSKVGSQKASSVKSKASSKKSKPAWATTEKE
tara:strand:+ start:403 stop:591 length:189 start_codon:yes stop_codon:yes gene_type:complete